MTAIAYDNPIPGFGTNNTINLRLWAAKPGQEFDLEAFNTGDYVQVLVQLCRLTYLCAVSFCSWGRSPARKARTAVTRTDELCSCACTAAHDLENGMQSQRCCHRLTDTSQLPEALQRMSEACTMSPSELLASLLCTTAGSSLLPQQQSSVAMHSEGMQ